MCQAKTEKCLNEIRMLEAELERYNALYNQLQIAKDNTDSTWRNHQTIEDEPARAIAMLSTGGQSTSFGNGIQSPGIVDSFASVSFRGHSYDSHTAGKPELNTYVTSAGESDFDQYYAWWNGQYADQERHLQETF